MSEHYIQGDIDNDLEITTEDYYNIYKQNRELKDKVNSLLIEVEVYKSKYNDVSSREYNEVKEQIRNLIEYIKSREEFINRVLLKRLEPEYGPLYYIFNISVIIGASALAGSFYLDWMRHIIPFRN